jgi:hypothetical protein
MTDTDRLDWLEKHHCTLINGDGVLRISLSTPAVTIIRRTVRQVVDEGMRRTNHPTLKGGSDGHMG